MIAPWTKVYAEVTQALDVATGADGTLRSRRWESPYVGASDRDYFDLLSSLWADGTAFIVVEHDIVIHPTALDELEACPSDWCGFPHEYQGELVYGMGCVKFGAGMIARNPDAMIRVGLLSGMGYPKRHWYRLDPFLQGVILEGRGERKCRHPVPVKHLGQGIPPAPLT